MTVTEMDGFMMILFLPIGLGIGLVALIVEEIDGKKGRRSI
ncbi:MAG: hypothetical protein ACK5NU_16375 [Fusobacterium ulcerans]